MAFSRPYGTGNWEKTSPASKLAGYFQLPLRGKAKLLSNANLTLCGVRGREVSQLNSQSGRRLPQVQRPLKRSVVVHDFLLQKGNGVD